MRNINKIDIEEQDDLDQLNQRSKRSTQRKRPDVLRKNTKVSGHNGIHRRRKKRKLW